MEPESSLDFVVDDLSGIGRSYQMTGSNGGRITVVIHHSGRRVVYGRNAGADQASTVERSQRRRSRSPSGSPLSVSGCCSASRWRRRSAPELAPA